MTWQDRIALELCESITDTGEHTPSQMTPGLTDTYDRELREKAGQRNPPVPPEFMGLEGEYDPCGLARRLARALDEDVRIAAIETVTLTQQGGAVAFAGQVNDQRTLDQIVDIAKHVDGTRSVDVSQVSVRHNSSK